MIVIGCGDCGGKYQIVEGKFDNPICPSCGTELPEKMRTPLKNLIEESRNRPNWKVFLETGNMFNTELTLKSRA
ncbi:MAG: hypothetical protein ACYDEQ_02405 [Desulfocucumaceae bacterium]